MRKLRRLAQALRDWSWTPLIARAAIWLGAFAALAQVGRGTVEELTVPSASAAPSPPPTAPPPPPAASSAPRPCPPSGAAANGMTAEGKVILNAASVDDLVKLPGVGRKRAEDIVAARDRLGRFRSVRDLLRVRGIGRRSLERLEPLIVLDPPAPPPPEAKEPP